MYNKQNVSREEYDILNSIRQIQEDMKLLHDRFNYAASELITDSLTYELLALKSKHKYFIMMAKELKLSSIAK